MELRRSGMRRVWALNTFLVSATLLLLASVAHAPAYDRSFNVPWPILALGFFATEVFVVHVQFRREAESFSLSEIPLVVALFFASPVNIVTAQFVGVSVGLLIARRQAPAKAVFNVAQMTTGTLVAWHLFHLTARHGDVLTRSELFAIFAAAFAAIAIGVFLVVLAISLAEGAPAVHMLRRVLPIAGIVALTNTSAALTAVAALRMKPALAIVLAIPAVTLYFAYRAYTQERSRHESMESLYESTQLLQRSLEMEPTIADLLGHARTMFRADLAQIMLIAHDADSMLTSMGPDGPRTEIVKHDRRRGVWSRVSAEKQAMLFAKPLRDEVLKKAFGAEGIRDAMAAPLFGKDGVIGVISVCNRLGDVSTFDQDDLRLLETVANHASVALENARLVSELQEALTRATELNRMKDEFVATVSHELRTPLTSIQGFVKTMLRDDFETTHAERESYLAVVDRQSERLRKLIDDLLLLSRLESRTIRIDESAVRIPQYVEQIIEDSYRPIRARIEVDFPGGFPDAITDGEKLRQILSNFIDNGLKYSGAEGRIIIRGREDSGGISISVEDQGCGLSPEQATRIWDRFYRVDQSLTRRTGGLGLGLYISKSLAEELGGRVNLEWSEPGRGSRFSLWLPLGRAAGAAERTTVPIDRPVARLASIPSQSAQTL